MEQSTAPKIWDHYDRAIGWQLRQVRQRVGLSIDDMAAETGLAASALAEMEAGKRTISAGQLLYLTHTLGVDMEMLVAVHC